ncbi:MAG: hypothetical protein EOP04_06245 [Proteobacteria bacterium]|nr:MAG: hypothetical protein EOP04_06245 [Pseudomonadota bacterium]
MRKYFEMKTTILALLPALITVFGNIIFYLWLKSRVDNALERQKIAYSGVFKERLDLYKEILKRIYDLKRQLVQYKNNGDPQAAQTFMLDTNDFIRFYIVNRLFLSDRVYSDLIALREAIQSVFDDLYMHHSVSREQGIDIETQKKLQKLFIDARNKLVTDDPFKAIEESIVLEVKRQLKVDEI